jgi:hypothetical protein
MKFFLAFFHLYQNSSHTMGSSKNYIFRDKFFEIFNGKSETKKGGGVKVGGVGGQIFFQKVIFGISQQFHMIISIEI